MSIKNTAKIGGRTLDPGLTNKCWQILQRDYGIRIYLRNIIALQFSLLSSLKEFSVSMDYFESQCAHCSKVFTSEKGLKKHKF